jgi:hypothetical protein
MFFKHAALAHNDAPAAEMRSEVIRAGTRNVAPALP